MGLDIAPQVGERKIKLAFPEPVAGTGTVRSPAVGRWLAPSASQASFLNPLA
jgi:hypothetical protein